MQDLVTSLAVGFLNSPELTATPDHGLMTGDVIAFWAGPEKNLIAAAGLRQVEWKIMRCGKLGMKCLMALRWVEAYAAGRS